MADEIQRRAKCRAFCFQQAREAFKGQLSDDQVILQIANDIYKEVFLEQATIATLHSSWRDAINATCEAASGKQLENSGCLPSWELILMKIEKCLNNVTQKITLR